jgi:phosphatidylinositol glycan class S
MTAVRSKPGYRISLSLLNPEPNRGVVSWDIKTATTDHLRPLLDRLSVLGKFTVESQILRYVSLGVTPRLDSKEGIYYLTQTDLPHTINPVESRLGTYISSDPNINFLVYVPPSNQSPLHILDENRKMGLLLKMNLFGILLVFRKSSAIKCFFESSLGRNLGI